MTGIIDQIIRSMQGGAPPSRNLPSDLEPLLEQLRQAGLGRQVDSWVGTGPNEPVEPEQLERALGGRTGGGGLGDILGGMLGGGGGASGGALGGGILGGLLAQALPYIINAMTPQGRVDDRDAPTGGLGSVIESITRGGGRMAPRDDGRLPDTGNGDDGLSGMLGRGLGERR